MKKIVTVGLIIIGFVFFKHHALAQTTPCQEPTPTPPHTRSPLNTFHDLWSTFFITPPTPGPTLKPCTSTTTTTHPSGSVVWPFPGLKDPAEFKRVDQGWDLLYNKHTDVLAVVSGTINLEHGSDPCRGGAGFGDKDTYPIEVVETPITINGRTYNQIYYGHVQYTKLGDVNAGDVIAHTYDCVNLGGVYVPWLEIGFWDPSKGPVATCHPTDDDKCPPTLEGTDMKAWLDSNTN